MLPWLINHSAAYLPMAFGMRMKQLISQYPGVKVTISPISITGNTQAEVQIAIKSDDHEKCAWPQPKSKIC